jgi:hypothetical protein
MKHDLKAGGLERVTRLAFVTAGGFRTDTRDLVLFQPGDQRL